MYVRSFKPSPTDLTANIKGTTVIDQNGDKCALIKIRTTETGFSFNCGMMTPVRVEQKVGETWVYVPYGIKRMTIQHPYLGTLDNYTFPVKIEKACTYIMDLVTARTVTTVKERITHQYVIFNVVPEDAVVTLDGKVLKTEDGNAGDYVQFGSYKWTASAGPYYKPASGTVSVTDPDNVTTVQVELAPAFGSIDVRCADKSSEGASIYIDGEKVGTAPALCPRVPGGAHELTLVKKLYKPSTVQVRVRDGCESVVDALLQENYAPVTVNASQGVTISLDGTVCGVSVWRGSLERGLHRILCSKTSHRDVERIIEVVSSEPLTVHMDAPEPITGTLFVQCTPAGSDVYLDGRRVGKTPLSIPGLLIGSHTVRVENENCEPLERHLTVAEGDILTLDEKLNDNVSVVFHSNAKRASFLIDGRQECTPGSEVLLSAGSHKVKVSAPRYITREKTVYVGIGSDNEYNVNLSHKIDLKGGFGAFVGGVPRSGILDGGAGSKSALVIGLRSFFSVGSGENLLNFRINAYPSLAIWGDGTSSPSKSATVTAMLPVTVGTRFNLGPEKFHLFLEPEFGYNIAGNNSSSAMFGGTAGLSFSVVDMYFSYYAGFGNAARCIGQVTPLFWAVGLNFNF